MNLHLCPHCLGKGTQPVRVQFTDRRRPCEVQDRECIICHGAKFVSEQAVQQFTAKYGSARRNEGEHGG